MLLFFHEKKHSITNFQIYKFNVTKNNNLKIILENLDYC